MQYYLKFQRGLWDMLSIDGCLTLLALLVILSWMMAGLEKLIEYPIILILGITIAIIASTIMTKRENEMKQKKAKEKKERLKRLKLRKKLQFMDLDILDSLTDNEFENYFSQQLDFLGIDNCSDKKSGEFGIDIFIKLDRAYGVQLKHCADSAVGISAVQQAYSGAAYYEKIPVILTLGHFTRQAVVMAEELKVELIDRTDIEKWHSDNYIRSHNHVKGGLYKEIKKCLIAKMEAYIRDKVNRSALDE